MKLDPTVLRYLTKEEFRALTAIEQGMKNHELVPTPLIISIGKFVILYHFLTVTMLAKIKHGGAKRAIETLHRNKLVWHDSKHCFFFILTISNSY